MLPALKAGSHPPLLCPCAYVVCRCVGHLHVVLVGVVCGIVSSACCCCVHPVAACWERVSRAAASCLSFVNTTQLTHKSRGSSGGVLWVAVMLGDGAQHRLAAGGCAQAEIAACWEPPSLLLLFERV